MVLVNPCQANRGTLDAWSKNKSQNSEGRAADPETEWRFYLSGLPAYLGSRIAGQTAAVRIARAVQAAELGLNEGGNSP